MKTHFNRHIAAALVALLVCGTVFLHVGCEPPKVGTAVPSAEITPEVEAEAKAFEPIPGKAVVYIYRKDDYADLSPYLFNGTLVGTISGFSRRGAKWNNIRSFIRVAVPEGTYKIDSDMSKGVNIPLVLSTAPNPRTLNAELFEGNVYYIRDELTNVPMVGLLHAFKFETPENAQPEILKYRMIHDFSM